MKLSEYARKNNITYRTAHRHWKQGLITGKQLNTGTIVVLELTNTHQPIKNLVVLCARVSNRCAEATENKTNLETQLNRLRDYATAKGYTIVKEIRETGSGLNDKRPLLEKILQADNWTILIAEHKDSADSLCPLPH